MDEKADMTGNLLNCVLLADRHHALSEGVRGLLTTAFRSVVMVADEASLFDSAARLQPAVVVVDLSLPHNENFRWVGRLRACHPAMKLILLSVYDESSVCRSAFAAGVDGLSSNARLPRNC